MLTLSVEDLHLVRAQAELISATDVPIRWCHATLQRDSTTLSRMAHPRHTLHVGIVVLGVVVGAVLSVFTGDPTVPLMFSGGAMSAIAYWAGAAAHRKHG